MSLTAGTDSVHLFSGDNEGMNYSRYLYQCALFDSPSLSLPLSRVHVNEVEYQVFALLTTTCLPWCMQRTTYMYSSRREGHYLTIRYLYVIISKTNPLLDVASGYIHHVSISSMYLR